MKKWSVVLIVIAFTIVTAMSCSKDKEDTSPKVVGCNKVEYQGYTWTITGCSNIGVKSFNTTITETSGGKTRKASFHIECSGGCIKSATVNNESLGKTITGP